ncbi:MAG: TonB-dependent receptor plug domain-containing protein, partial [Nitrospinales bacterium]
MSFDPLRLFHLPGDLGRREVIVVRGILFLLILFCFSPDVSIADENDGEPVELKPLVVTGTVFPTSSSRKSTVGLTVIDREQIQSSQATSVTELLRHVPGLHIDQAGGRGSVSSVYIRGADPNFTTVMIDGVKVNDPTNNRGGSFDFSTLSTDNIERIEIVRGPHSAIYGSDAMGGVINIITRRGKGETSVSVEAEGGRFDFARTRVRAGGSGERWDYSISASYLDNGEPVERSSFISKAVNANGGGSFSDGLDFRAVLRYAESESEAFPDDSGGPLFAVLRDVDEKDSEELSFGAQLDGEPSENWKYSAKFAMFHRNETISSPGVAAGLRDAFGIPANSADTNFQRYTLTLSQQFQLGEPSTFAVGLEGLLEEGSSRGELEFDGEPLPTRFDLDRKILAPFFEFQYVFDFGLSLRAGVRLDVPEGFDSEFSPRLGAAYTFEKTDTTVSA